MMRLFADPFRRRHTPNTKISEVQELIGYFIANQTNLSVLTLSKHPVSPKSDRETALSGCSS